MRQGAHGNVGRLRRGSKNGGDAVGSETAARRLWRYFRCVIAGWLVFFAYFRFWYSPQMGFCSPKVESGLDFARKNLQQNIHP